MSALTPAKDLTAEHSPGLPEWLAARNVSLAVTSYQRHRVLVIGQSRGRLKLVERVFDRPSGICAQQDRLWVATRYHLWRLENVLPDGDHDRGHDRVFQPLEGCTTGRLDVHDLALDNNGRPVFVNTAYSCLARSSSTESFEPVWQPSFISRLCAEDRCHLNGMAMREGKPAYATAAARSNIAGGWRHERLDGGVVLEVDSGEVVAKGLSMPHSPRWHDGSLWLLNAGRGELGRVQLATGDFEAVVQLPGFARGLAFVDSVAVVGVSKGREKSFEGLEFTSRLNRLAQLAVCGLFFVDTTSGAVVHWLRLEGPIEEISDLAVIPGCHRPNVIGFQDSGIRSLVTFEVEGSCQRHRNSVELHTTDPLLPPRVDGAGSRAQGPGSLLEVPDAVAMNGRGSSTPAFAPVQEEVDGVQGESGKDLAEDIEPRVFTAPVEDLLGSIVEMTFPSLRRRVQVRSLAKELLAVSLPGEARPDDGVAEGSGALALVELRSQSNMAEILSFWVRPDLRRHGWGQRLLLETEQAAKGYGAKAVGAKLRSTWKDCDAMERLLVRAEWSAPEARQVSCRFDMEEFLKQDDEPQRDPLPIGFSIVPWASLSEQQRQGVQQRQDGAKARNRLWFPAHLSPFQLEDSRVQEGPSKALLIGEEVAGWMTCHIATADTLQYTALFVDPGLRNQYLALELAWVVFNEQTKQYLETRPKGLRWGAFLTEAHNVALLRWIEVTIRRYNPVVSELRWSEKNLDS